MNVESVTQFPPGYDDRTRMTLTPGNYIVITHPVLPPMFYDETVMQWAPLKPNKENQ